MTLPRSCRNYNRYTATMPPKCMGGTGCEKCWAKWNERQGKPPATVDEAAARAEKRAAQAAERLASDYETLKPGDLGTKDEYTAPEYDREKKQEYDESMGDVLEFTREADATALAEFASLTAEQERRWQNKRIARSHALGIARELLLVRQFEQMATRMQWPATANGYAEHVRSVIPSRMVSLCLSDLHFGARLPADENPIAFDFTQANRRLAHLMVQAAEFKRQYRDQTGLNLLYNGDGMEGNLGHGTQFDQAPVPEQLVALARALFYSVAYAASAYPQVDVWFQPGNHGRDKLFHPGRAVTSKHSSFERAVMLLVRDRCAHLSNVRFHIPKAPIVAVPLYDKVLVMTHGDTEIRLKAPSASGGHKAWQDAIDKLGAERTWVDRCDLLFAGHFHDPAVMYFDTGIGLANGALVPPGGYARASGYRGPCGQFIFESVPGHAFGDSRFLRVGVEQDKNSGLDQIIPAFEW